MNKVLTCDLETTNSPCHTRDQLHFYHLATTVRVEHLGDDESKGKNAAHLHLLCVCVGQVHEPTESEFHGGRR